MCFFERRGAGEVGEERGDTVHLEKIEDANGHRLHLELGADARKAGEGVDDDGVWLHLVDVLVHRHEVLLEPEYRGTRGVKA